MGRFCVNCTSRIVYCCLALGFAGLAAYFSYDVLSYTLPFVGPGTLNVVKEQATQIGKTDFEGGMSNIVYKRNATSLYQIGNQLCARWGEQEEQVLFALTAEPFKFSFWK